MTVSLQPQFSAAARFGGASSATNPKAVATEAVHREAGETHDAILPELGILLLTTALAIPIYRRTNPAHFKQLKTSVMKLVERLPIPKLPNPFKNGLRAVA